MGCVLTGMGAVSAVGRGAAATCAAIRAQVSRPRKVHSFRVLDGEHQVTVPLTAYPVRGFTEGFHGVGRWLRLARGALADLLKTSALPGRDDLRFWKETALWAVAPEAEAPLFAVPEADPADLRRSLLNPLCAGFGLPVDEERFVVIRRGHAGMAEAVTEGLRQLARGDVQRLLIIAVDSYLEPAVLKQLAAANRLKTGERPIGLMPGEAGLCLLLEQPSSAQKRSARVHAQVTAAATGTDPNALSTGRPNTGQELASCIAQVLTRSAPDAPFDCDVYSDLNGEPWRAREWGGAVVRLHPRLAVRKLHLPCSQVGDTGAASGALGVCMAAQGMERPGPPLPALVISSSARGDVGCVCLHPVGHQDLPFQERAP